MSFEPPVVNWDIKSPDYRPSNVRIVRAPVATAVKYYVIDWNGVILAGPVSWEAANEKGRRRQATIKAAITRRRNKATRQ